MQTHTVMCFNIYEKAIQQMTYSCQVNSLVNKVFCTDLNTKSHDQYSVCVICADITARTNSLGNVSHWEFILSVSGNNGEYWSDMAQ